MALLNGLNGVLLGSESSPQEVAGYTLRPECFDEIWFFYAGPSVGLPLKVLLRNVKDVFFNCNSHQDRQLQAYMLTRTLPCWSHFCQLPLLRKIHFIIIYFGEFKF